MRKDQSNRENQAIFSRIDRKKRQILFKIPGSSDLICRKIRYQERMQSELGENLDLESISFYIANLEAQDWILVDPECTLENIYNRSCYCKVTTLLDASTYFSNEVRAEMLKCHMRSIEEIDFHLRSLNSSRGNGDTLLNLCTECLISPNSHEVKLLDLLWIKNTEVTDFHNQYKVELRVKGRNNAL